MKYSDEYRDPALAQRLVGEIHRTVTRPWTVMEICGGHTHAIMRYGLDQLLPKGLELVHGPGCPVCVTPVELIDKAVAIAACPEVILTTFGDMLRVPGSRQDLQMARSQGADVRMVYSPLEAVALARQHPERQVVFFAVGFETTAPANAMAVLQARREGLANFSELVSQVLVVPAMRALLAAPENRVQGYLAAGHVCTVMGFAEYEAIAAEYRVPIVPTGFEPLDILEGLLMVVRQLEAGEHRVENQYRRSVGRSGNALAQQAMAEVFRVADRTWRGIGLLPQSGLLLREEYAAFDAERRFAVQGIRAAEAPQCISGLILQGRQKPDQCPAFGRECTPGHPLGATMVSGEGACAAYFKYQHVWIPA
ncbi:MAG: hydrogenase formation protein HypD [Thermodesulfobacteriota bacterium]